MLSRVLLLGSASLLALVKQWVISHSTSVEFFGIYSTFYLYITIFQQLGGLGSQLRYSSELVSADRQDEGATDSYRLAAFTPFLFTAPILFFVLALNATSLLFVITAFITALLNSAFVIQTTRFYIHNNEKFCYLQAKKGLISLSPALLTVLTKELYLILIAELFVMVVLNVLYHKSTSLSSILKTYSSCYIVETLRSYGLATFLSVIYFYIVKIYVAASYEQNLTGIFFFAQIVVMISTNIQYFISVLLGPAIKSYHGRIAGETRIVLYGYMVILASNGFIFFTIMKLLNIWITADSLYFSSLLLLTPTIFVAILRASDVLSITVILLGRPLYATVQQSVALIVFSVLLLNEGIASMKGSESLARLLWFEFYSLLTGQFVAIIIFLTTFRKGDVRNPL